MEDPHRRLRGRIEVDTEFGSFLATPGAPARGGGEVRLDLAGCAKGANFHKAAWDAIDAMNNLAEQPLVVRSAGGRRAAAPLTEHGRRTVALYRALEAEYQGALATSPRALAKARPAISPTSASCSSACR